MLFLFWKSTYVSKLNDDFWPHKHDIDGLVQDCSNSIADPFMITWKIYS